MQIGLEEQSRLPDNSKNHGRHTDLQNMAKLSEIIF